MGTPIRLLAGLQNEIQMDLFAQEITLAVDRRVSHFPTPDNLLKRFAIDTNTPIIKIEMNGVIVDDEGLDVTTATTDSTPMRTLVNFGSMLPDTPFSPFRPTGTPTLVVNEHHAYTDSATPKTFPSFIARQSFRKGSVTDITGLSADGTHNSVPPSVDKFWEASINLPAQFGVGLKFTSASSIGATGALSVETALSVSGSTMTISQSPLEIGALALLNIGDRVVKSDSTFFGEVSALTDTSVTFKDALTAPIALNDELFVTPKCFNSRNELLGYVTAIFDDTSVAKGNPSEWTVQLSAETDADILEGETLTINQSNNGIEATLDNQTLKFVPSYWLEDPGRNPKGSLCDSDNARSVDRNANIGVQFRFNASKRPVLLGGSDAITVEYFTSAQPRSHTASYRSSSLNDSSAHDAFVSIPIKGIATTADKNPAVIMAQLIEAAFAVTSNVSSHNLSPDGRALPDAFSVTRHQSIVIVEQSYRPNKTITHPPVFSDALRRALSPELFQGESSANQNAKKSAGDKVQDLIGLVSNSNKDIDMFRGIQIPYDSLITSSGVTGAARNFFLTFGSLPASEKGSIANTRSASELMNHMVLTSDFGGNVEESKKDGFFDRVIDAAVPDSVQSIVGFLGDLLADTLVTLDTEAHANDGGIRIMPEKLHVRYDAGNNYYAFTLLLVATDFVLGV